MEIRIPSPQIHQRVRELGAEITDFYRDQPLTVVTLLNGAMFFAADLLREIELPLFVDTLACSSYADNKSTGHVNIRSPLKLPLKGRHVLIVDDILDTGRSLGAVYQALNDHGARSIRSCVLLDKDVQRAPEGLDKADWAAFRIPDEYVAGYGLDSNELYRNLRDIIVLK